MPFTRKDEYQGSAEWKKANAAYQALAKKAQEQSRGGKVDQAVMADKAAAKVAVREVERSINAGEKRSLQDAYVRAISERDPKAGAEAKARLAGKR